MKYVALAIFGGIVAFVVGRILFPVVLEWSGGLFFLILPILLVATLLLVRAVRRGRSGS